MLTEPITVRMTKSMEALEPMKVGDEFTVVSVHYNVAHIRSVNNGKEYYISEDLLNECFEAVTEEDETYDNFIDEIMDKSEFVTCKVFDKCTVVACKLPNGFVIVESSSCVDPDDYDEDIGIENCLSRIETKICELEAYGLHEKLRDFSGKCPNVPCNECPNTNCSCSKCGCDENCDDCNIECPDVD